MPFLKLILCKSCTKIKSTIDNTCNNDTQDKVKITGFIFKPVLICIHPSSQYRKM
jgi:hypothetical protein